MNLTKQYIKREVNRLLARQQELARMVYGWRELEEGVRMERIPAKIKALNTRVVWLLGEYQERQRRVGDDGRK